MTSCIKQKEVDLIVHNATIYTVDANFSEAEAMAIAGDSIVEIGPERQILNKYAANQTIDVRKNPVYPGFIDAHCHFINYANRLSKLDLKNTASFNAILEKLVQHYKDHPNLNWLEGYGWDQNDWINKDFPNKEKLDSLFPNIPVFLKRIDGHAALVNAKALALANINVYSKINGGIIEQKNGKLTGILIDNAVEEVQSIIPPPSIRQKIENLLVAQRNCFEVGLTTLDEAGINFKDVQLIDSLQKAEILKMNIYGMLFPSEPNLTYYLKNGIYETNKLTIRSFKFFADGALGSRGACLLQPYDDDDSKGLLLNEPSYFQEYAERLYDNNFQMNTHCIGDSANRLMLDIYSNVLKGSNDRRWRIEHAQIVHPNDVKKFREYSIIPSVQPTHATSDMNWATNRLGSERIKHAYCYKNLQNQIGLLALGTDFPVEPIDPMGTFYAAVSRKDIKGKPKEGFNKGQALTREEALKGMTIGAAIANFEEGKKGSLEVGKKADFVMLDRDILKIPEDRILGTKVVYTFIDGEVVYSIDNF